MNLKRRLRWYLTHTFVKPLVKGGLVSETPTVQHIAAKFPHEADQPSYTLPAYPGEMRRHPDSPFPIPPDPLWADYCTTVGTYLQSGLDDTTTMRRLCWKAGLQLSNSGESSNWALRAGDLFVTSWILPRSRRSGALTFGPVPSSGARNTFRPHFTSRRRLLLLTFHLRIGHSVWSLLVRCGRTLMTWQRLGR
jgi:hypothetical protein